MMFKSLFLACSVSTIITALAAPQQSDAASGTRTTSASPEQSAIFLTALQSYYSSLIDSPAITSLGLALAFTLPFPVLESITSNLAAQLPIPTTSFDLVSFATNPPLSYTTPSWQSAAGTRVAAQVMALETSVVLQAAGIAQSVIGTSVPVELTATGSMGSGNGGGVKEGVGMAIAAAAVAIGAAAVLL